MEAVPLAYDRCYPFRCRIGYTRGANRSSINFKESYKCPTWTAITMCFSEARIDRKLTGILGFLGSIFCFAQYISSPIFGSLSDVYGRKSLLIISICGSLLSYYLWAVADTFAIFLLSRLIGGLSKASISIAIVIVSDVCSVETRGRGMVSGSEIKVEDVGIRGRSLFDRLYSGASHRRLFFVEQFHRVWYNAGEFGNFINDI